MRQSDKLCACLTHELDLALHLTQCNYCQSSLQVKGFYLVMLVLFLQVFFVLFCFVTVELF